MRCRIAVQPTDPHQRQGVLVDMVPVGERTWTDASQSPKTTLACVECYSAWGTEFIEGMWHLGSSE